MIKIRLFFNDWVYIVFFTTILIFTTILMLMVFDIYRNKAKQITYTVKELKNLDKAKKALKRDIISMSKELNLTTIKTCLKYYDKEMCFFLFKKTKGERNE